MSAHNHSNFGKWIKGSILILVFLELVYLLVFNIMLNSSSIKERVNRINPDQFQLQWESAWTFYPSRLHFENLKATGESGAKEWQADIQFAAASVSLLSLLKHKIKICNMTIDNISYQSKEGKNFSGKQTEQQSEEKEAKTGVISEDTGEIQKGKHWIVELNGIHFRGRHHITTRQLKGELDGDIDTDLRLSTEDNMLSLNKGSIKIVATALHSRSGDEIIKQANLKGTFGIKPFNFKESSGGKLLKFITVDADISAQMQNLKIFNTQLQRIRKINLSGKGMMKSHILFADGKLLAGTKIDIDADKLRVWRDSYAAQGKGSIDLAVTKENPDTLDGRIIFGEYKAFRYDDLHSGKVKVSLFSGKGLALYASSSATLYPKPSGPIPLTSIGLSLPEASIGDIGLLQQYIPEKWGIELVNGDARVKAKAEIREKEAGVSLKLLSNRAKINFEDQSIISDLDLSIHAGVSTTPKLQADLTGSYIALNNTQLSSESKGKTSQSKLWNTKLEVRKGIVTLPLSENESSDQLSVILKKHKAKDILSRANGELKVTGEISQLDWINLLVKSGLDFYVSGSGVVDADLLISDGVLAGKSIARVKSENLEADLYDFVYRGAGEFTAAKTENKELPGVIYGLAFKNATIKHKKEKEPSMENVVMTLNRVADEPGAQRGDKALHMKILSAKVKDISIYNQYFPQSRPFNLQEGSADLNADIVFEPGNASGVVNLLSNHLLMRVDDQNISARLKVNAKLSKGDPRSMKFDISGTTIVIDQARVAGSQADYKGGDWNAGITFKKADIVWKKPLQLKSEIGLAIKDSRPIVAMIDNRKNQFAMISRFLIVENLQGDAEIDMDEKSIRIPYAYVRSSQADIGAKGIMAPGVRDGVIYFRHKNIKALMEMKNGKKRFDIFNAQQSFESYVIPSQAAQP